MVELLVNSAVVVLLRCLDRLLCRKQSRELSLQISRTLSLAGSGLLEAGLDLFLELLHGERMLSGALGSLLTVLVVLADQSLDLLKRHHEARVVFGEIALHCSNRGDDLFEFFASDGVFLEETLVGFIDLVEGLVDTVEDRLGLFE